MAHIPLRHGHRNIPKGVFGFDAYGIVKVSSVKTKMLQPKIKNKLMFNSVEGGKV